MDYLRIIEEREEELKREKRPLTLESIPLLTLSEFKNSEFAVKVFSSVLDCHVWFCPDEQMVEEILEDDPGAVSYTADELQKLIELNPSKDFLRKIHDTKTVFNHSKLKKKIFTEVN